MSRKKKDFLLKVQIDRSEIPRLQRLPSFLDVLDEADRPGEAVVLFGANGGARYLVHMAAMLQRGTHTSILPTSVMIEYHGEFSRPYVNSPQYE